MTRLMKLLLALTLLAFSLPVPAQTGGARGRLAAGAADDASWWTNPRVAERLNLSPDQQKRIESRLYESGQTLIELRASAQKAQLELSRLLAAEEIDDAEVRSALDRVTQAHCAIERERNLTRVEIAKVLSRDQRITLAKALGERRERIRERRR